MTSSGSSFDPAAYWVAPARNFRTSARLHLQHLLFQNTLQGRYLEPQALDNLPKAGHTKVADLGCGNGVWLLDLDHHLSEKKGGSNTFELNGYDINPDNFPPSHTLPQSVNFKTLDVLAPLPDDLMGSYDLVHIRAFASSVLNNDPSPILKTAMSLLKPGGWLQWEESAVNLWTASAPPGTAKTASDAMINLLSTGGRAQGHFYDWIEELDQHFAQVGFEETSLRQRKNRPADLKGWTEDYLMVWEELPAIFPSKAQAPQSLATKESFTELFMKVVAETERGVVIHQQKVVVAAGRKEV